MRCSHRPRRRRSAHMRGSQQHTRRSHRPEEIKPTGSAHTRGLGFPFRPRSNQSQPGRPIDSPILP